MAITIICHFCCTTIFTGIYGRHKTHCTNYSLIRQDFISIPDDNCDPAGADKRYQLRDLQKYDIE